MNQVVEIGFAHKFTYDGVVLAIYHAQKKEGLSKHSHAYDHAIMCNSGTCIVRLENKQVVLTKESNPVNLPAGRWHEIEALEDGTVFVNVFAENKY
jgi:quercetin dioxygenase-like cupin family protein